MKKLFKNILLFLCILSFVFCVACSSDMPFLDAMETKETVPESQNTQTIEKGVLKLAYYKGESLNPLKTSSKVNKENASLVYDSLIRISPEHELEYRLLQEYHLEGNFLTLRLKDNIFFSDGAPLSADDVISTLQCIQKLYGGFYKNRLSIVANIEKISTYELKLTLAEPNQHFIYLLDMPIFKKGTENDEMPIGTGRYIPENIGKDEIILRANKDYFGGGDFAVEKIFLTSYPDNDATIFALDTAKIDLLGFGISDKTKIAYKANTEQIFSASNQLTFVFYNNSSSHATSDMDFRGYLDAVINESELASPDEAYVHYPINPENKKYESEIKKRDQEIKKTDISSRQLSSGLLDQDNNGIFETYKDGKKLSALKILVGTQNERRTDVAYKISASLAQKGIASSVVGLSEEEFSNALKRGDFDLAICETLLANDGDFRIILSGMNEFPYCSYSNGVVMKKIDEVISKGTGTLEDLKALLTAWDEETPFTPLYFKKSSILLRKSTLENIVLSPNDSFYNIENWHYSET